MVKILKFLAHGTMSRKFLAICLRTKVSMIRTYSILFYIVDINAKKVGLSRAYAFSNVIEQPMHIEGIYVGTSSYISHTLQMHLCCSVLRIFQENL